MPQLAAFYIRVRIILNKDTLLLTYINSESSLNFQIAPQLAAFHSGDSISKMVLGFKQLLCP